MKNKLKLILFISLPMFLIFDVVQYSLGLVVVALLCIAGFSMPTIYIIEIFKFKKEEEFKLVSILAQIFYFLVGCYFAWVLFSSI